MAGGGFVDIACDYCGRLHKKRLSNIRTTRRRGYKVYCSAKCRKRGRQAPILEEKESQALPWGPTVDTSRTLQTLDGCSVQITDKNGEEPWPLRGFYWRYEQDGVGNWLLVRHRGQWGWDGRWGELGIESFEADLIYQEEA